MSNHPLAGKPAPGDQLIDVAALHRAYYERQPNTGDPQQLVSFGTSGHRGTSASSTFTEAHILAITQAICDYGAKNNITGPLFVGKDTHALSGPAQCTALEVIAANDDLAVIQEHHDFTPTPVISRAILTHNHGRTDEIADGIVITPSHNPPEDGGCKYNPPNGGPAETDITRWIQDRANTILRGGNREVKRVAYEKAITAPTTHQRNFVRDYVADLKNVIDMTAIRDSGISIGVDPLGGASLAYWEPIAAEYGLKLEVVNKQVDPTFSFMTLDAKDMAAQAVAIRAGKIVFVGGDEQARAFIGPKTDVYQALGRTVIPGLNETHVHPTGAASGEVNQPFTQLHSIGEIQEWVRKQVAATPSDKWIRLPRVDVTRIKERRMPTSADLDAAAGERPAVFVWQYANRQVQVLNRAAMKAAGITRDTTAPKGARIGKDSSGELSGVLEDAGALTSKWLPRASPSPEEYLASLEKLLRLYNRCGITSITDRGTGVDGWKAFRELQSQGRLPVRTTLTIRVGSDGTVEGTERFIRGLPFRFGEGDDWVKIGPLKIGVDGGVLYGTAYMREPYGPQSFSLYGLDDPQYRGLLQMNAEKVTNVIRTGHRLGWQMCSHVTGDAGVDMVLDAVTAANSDSPIAERRYTLIHAYFAHADTAKRCASLGVCIDTQPAWFYKDGDALADALGEKRMEEFIGLKTWQDAGLKIALNSDHMQGFDPDLSLNPYNPFIALYTAVTRKTESGAVHGASQAVSRKDALKMLTSDAAWLHFDEKKKGTLEVGKLGDLAVLSADYFSCPEEEIKKIRSVLTVIDGKVVYRAE